MRPRKQPVERNATHIVVGAGSAGSVIAARLSEDADKHVLLIESGADTYPIASRCPAGVFGLIGKPAYDWSYPGEPIPSLSGRSLRFPAGRIVGGSSAINGLVYARGAARDFDEWVARGATDWGWDAVLPFFRRSEDFSGAPSPAHGVGGEMTVSPVDLHPLAERFLGACAELGIERRDDYCTGNIDGGFPTMASIRQGRRSGGRDFLRDARRRGNFNLVTRGTVERLIIDSGDVVGIRYRGPDGELLTARASAETILCAGAFGTPAILQRSGLGPGRLLQRNGISIVRDMAGIGADLCDHLSNGVARNVVLSTYNDLRNPLRAALAGMRWGLTGAGPLGSASVHAMAYGRSDVGQTMPDFMLSFVPVNTDWSSGAPELHRRRGIFIAVNPCRTRVRGSVAIAGPNAHDGIRIDYDLLADEHDRRVMLAGLKAVARIVSTAAFAPALAPDQEEELPSTDEAWREWLIARTALGYHSVGTCRMGPQDAPLDPHLRLRGVGRLRVADASVMPTLVSGNTNAAVMMIAERAAAFVRNEDRQ